MSIFRHLRIVVLLPVFLVGACSDSSDPVPATEPPAPEPPPRTLLYKVDITKTPYGIPHVKADDWGSLGYGYAYTIAQDNFCVMMRAYVEAKGESAKYWGDDGDINLDLVMKLYNDDARIKRTFVDAMGDNAKAVINGYVAGFNRYLQDTGVDNLVQGDDGCRGETWVREIDIYDVGRLFHSNILGGSAVPLSNYIAVASPPAQTSPAPVGDAVVSRVAPAKVSMQQWRAAIDEQQLAALVTPPEDERLGSNAYAIGANASQTDYGVMLGNPHFPWQGQRRFYVSHLTMGDEYDVFGGTLYGLPMNVIGFNNDIAWSHTVSTGRRFTLYELTLNPENPMQYMYNGEVRNFETVPVTVERKTADGSVETVEHTFYLSHFGPVVDLGEVSPLLAGWPNAVGTLLTYRDANLENMRGVEQWLKMGQASNMAEFTEALKPIGIPWVNTIAADRHGDAFYGDISVNPHVSAEQYSNCIRGTLQTLLTGFGLPTLDGSDTACEWGSDADTTAGVFGYDSLPKLETRDYGANANGSYWLANPRQLITGYSPIIGAEGTERSLRTRQTFVQAEDRIAGTDGLGAPGFNVDNIRTLLYQSTNIAADLVMDDVVAVCEGVADWSVYGGDATKNAEACGILKAWDRAYRVDSVGGHIFWEQWQRLHDQENLWAVPFDPADSVNTPRDLNIADESVKTAVISSLIGAVQRLQEAGIALDAPWGEVQYDEKNGVKYGIPGGSSSFMFSVITTQLVDGEGYSSIRHGNSYIQAVTWDESSCPNAYAMITYSQSTDPASDHYADSTELYSKGGWIDAPYCAEHVERDAVSTTSLELYDDE